MALLLCDLEILPAIVLNSMISAKCYTILTFGISALSAPTLCVHTPFDIHVSENSLTNSIRLQLRMFESLGLVIKLQIGISQCYNSCWKIFGPGEISCYLTPIQNKRYNAFISKFHWLFVLLLLDDATKLAFNAGNFNLMDRIDGPECYPSQFAAKEPHSQPFNSRV